MFERFRKWFNSTFVCIRCSETFYGTFFGYGRFICPNCYEGEDPWLFIDYSYILNRFWM